MRGDVFVRQEAQDLTGSSPLCAACERSHLEVVRFLIDVGCNVNAQQMPLHRAMHSGQLPTVRFLAPRT